MENNWKKLTEEQKTKYQEYCDNKYGKTFVLCETGEPMYMTKEGYMVDTRIIIDLLFSTQNN